MENIISLDSELPLSSSLVPDSRPSRTIAILFPVAAHTLSIVSPELNRFVTVSVALLTEDGCYPLCRSCSRELPRAWEGSRCSCLSQHLLAHPVGLEPTSPGLTDRHLHPVELRCINFGAGTRDRTETSCSSGERADPLRYSGIFFGWGSWHRTNLFLH